ncbi:MAG: hypothetical protein K2P78_08145 [Gemmataceae bacterium]|nr:hypothetical protein [Gemmataceae bacterium]
MGEPYLTMAEIEAKYPNEWVLIDRPTTRGTSLAPTGGHVVIHCADRDEFLRRVAEWNGPDGTHVASWYTGAVTDDELLPAEAEPGVA